MIELKETMTFEQEMNRFFKAYSQQQRTDAEAHPEYQKAAREKDPIKACEIAQKVIQGDVTPQEFKLIRKYR
ncbi:MAG TPA: hypothetical protein VHZ30_03790 [Verrucomicrobiae bacterium]|jgi:hypothetical protein|nr:hypothetical protein [Verrucomicrobiae bacterium]